MRWEGMCVNHGWEKARDPRELMEAGKNSAPFGNEASKVN